MVTIETIQHAIIKHLSEGSFYFKQQNSIFGNSRRHFQPIARCAGFISQTINKARQNFSISQFVIQLKCAPSCLQNFVTYHPAMRPNAVLCCEAYLLAEMQCMTNNAGGGWCLALGLFFSHQLDFAGLGEKVKQSKIEPVQTECSYPIDPSGGGAGGGERGGLGEGRVEDGARGGV